MFSLSKKVAALSAVVVSVSVLLVSATIVRAQSFVNTGSDLLVANVTKGITWANTQTTDPGNIVEFRMLAQNKDPNSTINNAVVKAVMPAGQSKTLVVQATVTADNAPSITESATINVTGPLPQGINYVPGHAVLINKSCPSGCSVPDAQVTSGVPVGNLGYNEWAQVVWKAALTNIVPSPSPSVSPSVAPSPVPSVAPSQAPVATVTCVGQNGIIITVARENANTLCQSQQQSQTTTVTNTNTNTSTNNNTVTVSVPSVSSAPAVLAAATSPVKELPSTGLPLAGLALASLAPVGLKLKRFGKVERFFSANSLWQRRQFMRD